jgi:hypothetical protein
MDARERRGMRARLSKFGTLSEPEQQALVDAKFSGKTPEERARILRDLREASRQLREPRGAAGLPPAAPEAAPPAVEAPARD